MEPDRIKVNLSRTINLGNYENIKIEVGYETMTDTIVGMSRVGTLTDELIESINIQSKKFKHAIKLT